MLTRSSRKLPPDFNENQPVGRRLKLNPREERHQILVTHPTLPAAFPTLDSPPPRKARPLWSRDAARAANDDNDRKQAKNKRRRIDMTEDDLLMELLGDNMFLDAQIGCAEAALPFFGQGNYEAMFIPKYNEDDKIDLGLPILDDLNPGELDLPLFFDEDSSENWGLHIPASSSFKELASGVKMAIMIEAVAIYNIAKAPDALRLTADDIDDYVRLYDHEAANDAAHAYNIQMEEEWEMMHRMNGRTDFANYDPPDRRPTFRSALSLIKRKDVDAGQRYLNMVGQTVLVNRLEDYVGCAAAGTFKFIHPVEQKRRVRASNNYPTPESMAGSDPGDNVCITSTNEEDVVRDGRRLRISATSPVIFNSEVSAAQSRAMDPHALPASSLTTATTIAQAQTPAATAVAHHGSNWAKHNLDATPLLAQPPKRRRRLVQGRPEQPKLPQPPSYAVVEDQQPECASPKSREERMAAPVRAETPPPSVTELVRDMSSNTRRNMSRPDDEPENARNVLSSPIRMAFAEPRRPRVAHLERPGQNPTRHSSGNGSSIVRTSLKMKRQLSSVYRPERQWAEQAHSSSPLGATTPRPVTPRSGSKEYFLSEQRPDHPLSSPRLFDDSGKTIREKPQTPEELQRIFKMQEEEAKRQRQIHLHKIMPGEPWPPALPSSTTSLGFQTPVLTAKVSAQQAAQDTAQQQVTPRRPEPILPPASITPGSYQRPFANQMKSKQASVQGPSMPAPVTPRKTDPILPPRHPALTDHRATSQLHVISQIRSSQVGAPTSTSTSANDQPVQRPPNGASLSTPALNCPPSQQPPQTAVQQPVMQQGPRPAGQPFMRQKPVAQRHEVRGSAMKAPAPRQKASRSKTTTTSTESTAGRIPPVKLDSDEKPLGPAKLKSTYKPPPQTLPVERPIYQPPHAGMESGSQSAGYYQTPLPIPTHPQLPHNQAQPNTMKGAHGMLPSTNHATFMAGSKLRRQQPGGDSYYNNSFAAHSKATFGRTVQDFTRDPPRGNHTNQFTKTKAANPLQGPQDFSGPSRGPKIGTPNNGSRAPAHPNPFRNGSSSSQASPDASPAARPASAGHAAQYYVQQPQQPRQFQQPYQPQQPPARKQKVVHEPRGSPERPLWDRNNRNSSPGQPPPMMGSVAQAPFTSNNGLSTIPQPSMQTECMSGVMSVAPSAALAQAMKSNGVQLPGQLAEQAFEKRKRNVGAKVQASSPQGFPPQVFQPQLHMYMGVFGSPAAPRATWQAQGPPETPKKSPGNPRGADTKVLGSGRKTKDLDPKQTTM